MSGVASDLQVAAPAASDTADDRGAPVLANFGDVSGYSAEQLTTFKASLIKAGHDAATVEAHLAGSKAPQAAAADATARQPLGLNLDPWKHPALSDGERQILADNLRRHWTGDPAVLQQAIEGATTAEAISTAIVSDPRSDAEKAFDAQFGGAAPEAYELDGIFVGRENVPVENRVALAADLRDALSAMKIPGTLAKGIAGEMLDSATKYGEIERQSPVAVQLWQREQGALLDRVSHGAPRDFVLGLAAYALGKVPQDVRDTLLEQKAFETASAVMQLAHQGRRLLMREQMAERRKS